MVIAAARAAVRGDVGVGRGVGGGGGEEVGTGVATGGGGTAAGVLSEGRAEM